MEVKVGQSFVGCYQKKSSGSESVMALLPVCCGILSVNSYLALQYFWECV